jgi:tetratricopeptide (TPR) repeat protein
MKNKQNWFYQIVTLMLILVGLLSAMPLSVSAIGEVTPTPAPMTNPTIDVEALMDEALASLQAGDFMTTIDLTNQVLTVDPENIEAYVFRGVAHVRLGRNQDGLNDFTTGLEYAPYSFNLYIFRGDTYAAMGDNVSALLDYEKAIEIYPLNLDAFSRRAEIYYALGDNVSGDIDDFIANGLTRADDGDLQAAIDFFTSAIQTGGATPAVALAYYSRGITYLNMEDDAGAIQDFTGALSINPNLHNAYLARGISYRQAGDLQRAGSDFQQRITIHGAETIPTSMAIGDTVELEMVYRRVYSITFSGSEGQRVSLSARDMEPTMIDPLIALLDPQGNPIAGDDDFGAATGGEVDAEITDFILPATGSYTLLVSHAEGGYAVGFEGLVRVSIQGQ